MTISELEDKLKKGTITKGERILLEAKNLDIRKDKISQILSTYTFDDFNNTTIQ